MVGAADQAIEAVGGVEQRVRIAASAPARPAARPEPVGHWPPEAGTRGGVPGGRDGPAQFSRGEAILPMRLCEHDEQKWVVHVLCLSSCGMKSDLDAAIADRGLHRCRGKSTRPRTAIAELPGESTAPTSQAGALRLVESGRTRQESRPRQMASAGSSSVEAVPNHHSCGSRYRGPT